MNRNTRERRGESLPTRIISTVQRLSSWIRVRVRVRARARTRVRARVRVRVRARARARARVKVSQLVSQLTS